MKRILSLDGGGIRGIGTAHILDWIEQKAGKSISQLFDLIAGTSTGGILAAILTVSKDGKTPMFSAADVVKLYLQFGELIFSRHWYEPLAELRVKYSADGIEATLKHYLGESRLASAITNIMITAGNEASNEPYFFKSWEAKLDPTKDCPVWIAARATSAAPTYFPPEGTSFGPMVDGGMFAANPAMCAWTEYRYLWPGESCYMLSLGTGRKDSSLNAEEVREGENWGLLQLVPRVINQFQEMAERTIEHQCKLVMGKDYDRVQGEIKGKTPDHAMDNATQVNQGALLEFFDKVIADNESVLLRAIEICKV